jgi:hypothetical protein
MASTCIMCGKNQTKHFIWGKIALYGFMALITVVGSLEATHSISARIDNSWAFQLAIIITAVALLGYYVQVLYRCLDWLVRQHYSCAKCNQARCSPSDCHHGPLQHH